jgi:hypothetical protein
MGHSFVAPFAGAVLVALALTAGSAQAQIQQEPDVQAQDRERQQQTQQRQKARSEGDRATADRVDTQGTVSAREILGASVTDGHNHIGRVRDLILDEDGSTVEFVLYEIPFPYDRFGAQDGFVSFQHVTLERGAAYGTRVRFTGPEPDEGPDTLEITAEEADRRLLSRVMREPVAFADDRTLPLEDVLIREETGEIAHYVVNMDPDALFAVDPRRIPAQDVRIEDGQLVSTAEFAALERLRE